MSSNYRLQLESWLEHIDVRDDIVTDVGGGQNPITKRVNSWQVSEYYIIDNDAQYKPDHFADLNHPLPDSILTSRAARANIVFCLEVAEYIWNPLQFHQNIYSLLKEGGIAYISYPTLYPLHNPPGIDYLRYTKNAIEKYLAEAGFKTWEITPRVVTEGVGGLQQFWNSERLRPMKGTNQIYDMGYLIKAYKGEV